MGSSSIVDEITRVAKNLVSMFENLDESLDLTFDNDSNLRLALKHINESLIDLSSFMD